MFRTHTAHVLLAALALLCAQGCRHGSTAPRAAGLTQQPPGPPAAASATPTPYAPRYSAELRGDDAFESFVKLSGGRAFESREVERKPARKDLKVRANYPVLLGDDGAGAREFNRRARAFVVNEVTPYLESEPDPEKQKDPHWKDVQEFYNVYHKVVFASDDFVSVLFYIAEYHWGAGHGMHKPVSFNFDLRTGREVKLAQLFKPRSRYLQTIAKLCDEDLKRQFPNGGYPGGYSTAGGGGVKPQPDNYKAWVVTRDGLVIIFEEYQVVAYADGEPKVLIPFDNLKEFLDPRGVTAALAAQR